ncbi:unnamed protein product [Fusarium graminearum]|uniref:Chromosome 4, complete genome n=2 Tax=Gibberella zeae TaxID=5518 RepID=A0A098DQT0_GIBZE|nr:unnamed protein product [Fusarium graminearum]CAF3461584.1 unnamed protein product [Fusarium graminearum]CAF3616427.1 unnamed protein product [Fusarium graminearum]CAG1972503.1 unnamed protein product [Fusarium graminearum]CAG1980788.1 unnamed protein product [Fusarium graminearum]
MLRLTHGIDTVSCIIVFALRLGWSYPRYGQEDCSRHAQEHGQNYLTEVAHSQYWGLFADMNVDIMLLYTDS